MRRLLLLCALALLLSGCVLPTRGSAPEPGAKDPTAAPSVESSSGAQIPSHDPSFPETDGAGMTPYGVVNRVIGARNSHDWERWYSLYATPSVDFAVAKNEATEADEDYDDFNVLEVRITSAQSAFVRVSYEAVTAPPDGEPYEVSVPYPGERWPLHKVDGLWKVQWMPRQ